MLVVLKLDMISGYGTATYCWAWLDQAGQDIAGLGKARRGKVSLYYEVIMHSEVICTLHSLSPFSSSKVIGSTKKDGESDRAFEERTWRERCHISQSGNVVIPPMAFANSIKQAAKYANLKIPGERNSTYTKHFDSGVMVLEGLELPVKAASVDGEWLFVPSDGVPGGGKRVHKCFPVVTQWSGVVKYIILDPKITEAVFKKILQVAGNMIGVGRFRPRNRGYYGRYQCVDMQWMGIE